MSRRIQSAVHCAELDDDRFSADAYFDRLKELAPVPEPCRAFSAEASRDEEGPQLRYD